MATVTLSNIKKSYGKADVIHGIDIDIADGEFVVLVGPSGCGKSTLLRMLAGLETISDGTIEIDGTVVNDLEPKDRDIAMVFQNYALYPHMTVATNMGFSLEHRGASKTQIAERVQWAAGILGLGEYLDRYPRQLSGGQRQRVAMGRAIVRDPKVFLFDEPLSNLDAKLRVLMRGEIKSLHQRLKTTTVYVTHDPVEAMTMADKIVVLSGGRIQQIGAPLDLYDRPVNQFVAGFIGSPGMNFVPGTIRDGRFAALADDADAVRQNLADRGAWACVKPMPTRTNIPAFSRFLYRFRNTVERYFNKIKHFLVIATRYEMHDANFLAIVKLASIRIWLRAYESVSLFMKWLLLTNRSLRKSRDVK